MTTTRSIQIKSYNKEWDQNEKVLKLTKIVNLNFGTFPGHMIYIQFVQFDLYIDHPDKIYKTFAYLDFGTVLWHKIYMNYV